MTRADHQSGTERLAEVVEKCAFSDDTVIVNVQGDEPMIPAAIIRQVAENGAASGWHGNSRGTYPPRGRSVQPERGEGCDGCGGLCALFLPCHHPVGSRSLCGVQRDHWRYLPAPYWHLRLSRWLYSPVCNRTPSPLEHIEMLEQLRVLWYGEKIHVAVAEEVRYRRRPEDLERVRAELR